jgi:dTDP-glucose 4,6-dehydratase
MKNFLVTGGSGFIGSNFCELISKKNKVINIDKLTYCSVPDRFKNINRLNYKLVKSDISNEKVILKIFNKYKINFLVNFASESHVDRSIANPKKFINQNINSTLNLLEILRKLEKKKKLLKDFKFIHISTDEVYGSSFKPLSEDSNLMPNSPYASSKASIDLLIRSYGKTYDLPYVICRPCNNFGAYQFPEKFVPTIITKILQNKKIPIYGDGKNYREWIHVNDTCRAILAICLNAKKFEIYNIGTSVRLRNIDLYKIIFDVFKFKNKNFKDFIKKVYDRPGHDRSYSINSSKLNNNIFKVKNDKKEIIKKITLTTKWFLKNKTWVDYCFSNYKGKRLG